MLIDWFTVFAQALNFLILVWLMRRYLYRPILNAIDAREKLVADKLAGAEAKMLEATSQLTSYNQKNEEFEAQKKAKLAEAAGEAEQESAKIVADAHTSAEAMMTQMTESIDSKYRSLADDIKRRTCDGVLEVSRSALSDLASTDLEERMVLALDRKLRNLGDQERSDMLAKFEAGGAEVVVRTALELSPKQRETVQSLLNDVLGLKGPAQFETAPELVSGIELSAPGAKIAWSIDDYLRTLDERVGEILNVK